MGQHFQLAIVSTIVDQVCTDMFQGRLFCLLSMRPLGDDISSRGRSVYNEVHPVLTVEKRLLLNDPDVLVNRLNRLESIMSVLNSTVQQQSLTIQQQQTSIHQQEHTIKQLQNTISNSQRYAGGGYYGETGSAAEYVCLPPDPNYEKTSGPDGGSTVQATSVIMIPGKNTCYSGWKEEYHGYLASGDHTHNVASAYVCVDINPEYIIGGVDRHYGKLFYPVLTRCGSLKCPPYINNYPLTCVYLVTTEEKRLLLNDPDVLVNRLNRLESVLAVLNSTVQQISTENQQQSITIQQQQISNQHQEHTIKQLQDTIRNYQRFAGGGYYGESGSAAEYVCLPPDPNYVKTSGGADNGHMYGAEFNSNFFASNANGEDVPCALCRTNQATSVIMIPGKNTCYSGWKLEYHGYLASGYYGHTVASAYVCVDIKPEYVMGGVDFHYGKLFYDVLTKCGSLKCPPYINDYPLTCVVCSK
ncbi:unnamed protein product [Mytilus edulis]|uniref:Uncharacterized protein n=1 Tax=Mytilus edulis TaxID=6550 RepID=A0A8S3ULU9_MYTED|nr:unnamed protein product [Mytilus edulis]